MGTGVIASTGLIATIARSFPETVAFPRLEPTVAHLRQAMGEDEYERNATRGRAMDADELALFAHSALTRTIADLDAP